MPTETPKVLLGVLYSEAGMKYLRNLPVEHFAEPTDQATQREITLASFDLVTARRSDFQVFNELLVQYPLPRRKRPGQVVPDNMVVIHPEPIDAEGSYDVPLQPVGPFWVLEYVSKSNRRKDYDDNMQKYEHDLKVPYYLLFTPDKDEMTLYHHTGERYVSVKPADNGRCAIPELEMDVALLDGWVRFWHRGELLPLPGDLLRDLEATRQELAAANRRADTQTRRADIQARRAEAEARRADALERELA